MYAQHFGLAQAPFTIAPDPRYLFMSERHREALAHLLYGLRGGGGFVVLTGEIGAGKTTVCRCFLEQIPPRCNVAYVFNPKLTVEELLQTVCAEFHVPPPVIGARPASVKDYVDSLNEFLLRTHAVGQNNVLIIDEAQNLSADVLEQLRLLTNLETNERKLLQIVLIGQPELRAMLARPELEQLAQRVIARYHLDALSRDETAQYVRHRLAVAGAGGAEPFDDRALARIHRDARGVPRRINLLCDRALLGAYARGERRVSRAVLDAATREVLDTPDFAAIGRARRRSAALVAAGVAGGAALAVAVGALYGPWAGERDRVAAAAAGALASGPGEKGGAGERTGRSAVNPAGGRVPGAGRDTGGALTAEGGGATTGATGRSAAADGDGSPGAAARGRTPAAFDLAGEFASLVGGERQAWMSLAQAWKIDVGDADPCTAARSRDAHCWRTSTATLALIGQLDRPGVLTLRDRGDRAAYAMISGLTDRDVVLRIAGSPRTVSRVALAGYWRGEFATLWRVPTEKTGTTGDGRPVPTQRWLARQLSAARGDAQPVESAPDDATLKGWIHAFQLTRGLPSDGVAGPITLMQLNRATGVDEPRLRAEE